MTDQERDLERVRKAAKLADSARGALHTQMRVAKGSGASLRAIAAAAGCSTETARTIVKEA